MTPKDWMRKGLEEHGQDLLQEMVAVFCQALMHTDVERLCGAPYGARSPERVNQRNGYRPRTWNTRIGHPQPRGLPLLPVLLQQDLEAGAALWSVLTNTKL